jgi:hypothetical protein
MSDLGTCRKLMRECVIFQIVTYDELRRFELKVILVLLVLVSVTT